MDYLRRHTAPVSERIWHALDEAVAQAARHVLAARRIATFDGPHGWEYIAARLGTMTPCGAPPGRAVVCVPNVVLLSEIADNFVCCLFELGTFVRALVRRFRLHAPRAR